MSTDRFDQGPEEEARLSRVEELERENEALRLENRRLLDVNARLTRFFEMANETIAISEKGIILETNPRVLTMFGYEREDARGRRSVDFIAPASRELVARNIGEGYEEPYEVVALRKDGSTFEGEFRGKVIEYEGRPARITMVVDISARKRVEEALRDAAVQAEVIRAQAQVVADLSTPLLPIAPGVLLLPLIGELSVARGHAVLEALLAGVARHRASIALLDITGVPRVDAAAAAAVASAARAVRLLGARTIVTGVRPEVAQAIIALGVDLGGIETAGTLQQGVARALDA